MTVLGSIESVRRSCSASFSATGGVTFVVALLLGATPLRAGERERELQPVVATPSATAAARIEANRELAQRKYGRQMTSHWQLGQPGTFTIDGKPRAPWWVTTWGPLNRESGFQTTGAPDTSYTGEFQMYWNRIPDFRIDEYQVWPNEQGWIARLIFAGTANDGTPVRAHQVDIVTVDDTGKVARIEYHCDAGEWIDQVWSKASRLSPAQVRLVLAQPHGWNSLIAIALGRAKG